MGDAISIPSAASLLRRVLFVDFDGVLHATHGPAGSMREFRWMPILLDMLNVNPEVGIVVHASARQTSPAEFLHQRCGVPSDRWLGVTDPTLPRWKSIQTWLDAHPEVRSFRILDGQPGEFPSPPPKQLILCSGTSGISDETVQRKLTH